MKKKKGEKFVYDGRKEQEVPDKNKTAAAAQRNRGQTDRQRAIWCSHQQEKDKEK